MLPLGATSQLVDCHLSLLFLQIDGFQNVFWHVRAACVVACFGSFLFPISFHFLCFCFCHWHWGKKVIFLYFKHPLSDKAAQQALQVLCRYNSNMQIPRIIWGSSHLRVASAYNSVNLFSGIWFHTQLTMHNSMKWIRRE